VCGKREAGNFRYIFILLLKTERESGERNLVDTKSSRSIHSTGVFANTCSANVHASHRYERAKMRATYLQNRVCGAAFCAFQGIVARFLSVAVTKRNKNHKYDGNTQRGGSGGVCLLFLMVFIAAV
jgi:hypothetical protein